MATRCLWDSKVLGRITIHKKASTTIGNLQIYGYLEGLNFDIIYDDNRLHESVPKDDIEKITIEDTGEILWQNPSKRDLARWTEIPWMK